MTATEDMVVEVAGMIAAADVVVEGVGMTAAGVVAGGGVLAEEMEKLDGLAVGATGALMEVFGAANVGAGSVGSTLELWELASTGAEVLML